MKTIAKLFIVFIMLFLNGCDDEQMFFREIFFDTAITYAKPNTAQSLRPNIIVQVIPKKGTGESFILSNEVGVGFMPLRVGKYCYKAYDINGHMLQLDPSQRSCFSVKKEQLDVEGMIGVAFTEGFKDTQISIGFAHIVAVKASLGFGETESERQSVVLRVISQTDKRENFVFSDVAGAGEEIRLVPFRPGNYCFEVYDRNVQALQLDTAHPSCFTIQENETTEVKALIQDK